MSTHDIGHKLFKTSRCPRITRLFHNKAQTATITKFICELTTSTKHSEYCSIAFENSHRKISTFGRQSRRIGLDFFMQLLKFRTRKLKQTFSPLLNYSIRQDNYPKMFKTQRQLELYKFITMKRPKNKDLSTKRFLKHYEFPESLGRGQGLLVTTASQQAF